MELDEIRRIFKENELRSFSAKGREFVFVFDNNHQLSIKMEGRPGINQEWDEFVRIKLDERFIADI